MYKFSKSELFGYTEICKTVFLKHFIKVFLLKSGIRKDVTVSVNKELMNKS